MDLRPERILHEKVAVAADAAAMRGPQGAGGRLMPLRAACVWDR